jgi:hypothetical protein
MRRSKSCGIGGYLIFAGRQQIKPKFPALINGSFAHERSTNRPDFDRSADHSCSACVLDRASQGPGGILRKCAARLTKTETKTEEDRKQQNALSRRQRANHSTHPDG